MSNETCFQRFTQQVERGQATKLIRSILKAGYVCRVHDGEEFNTDEDLTTETAIKNELATTGEDRLYFRKPGEDKWAGWVWLIWGNGEDLISDYTANDITESFVQPIYEAI